MSFNKAILTVGGMTLGSRILGFARDILTSEVLTVEGRLQRLGKHGLSISIIMEKVIRRWSGQLSHFLREADDTEKTA